MSVRRKLQAVVGLTSLIALLSVGSATALSPYPPPCPEQPLISNGAIHFDCHTYILPTT